MRAVTANQMKQIELNSLEYGATFLGLMENAGVAAFNIIKNKIDLSNKRVAVLCGKGNNGGDGFVVACCLKQNNNDVTIFLTDGDAKSQEARLMQNKALQSCLDIKEYSANIDFDEFDIIVDAIFGTGFAGLLSEKHAEICKKVNGSKAISVSLDIPTGISSDNGFYDKNCIRADYTIAFDSLKVCHILSPSAELCGETITADIGINEFAHNGIDYNYELIDSKFVFSHLAKKNKNSHKGSNGKLLNISGSRSYSGAAVLSSVAAARCGVGYVCLASTGYVSSIVAGYIPEVIYMPQEESEYGGIVFCGSNELLKNINNYSSVLIGCGLGNNCHTQKLVCNVIESCKKSLIIDADGINIVSQNIDILKKSKANIILTPHLGEMSRLAGITIDEINKDRLNLIISFSRQHNAVVVLKGPNTIVAAPSGKCYVNRTGNAGLAKAGSGDILSGMISSFSAQGLQPEIAAACGVYLHGAAADLTAKRLSQYSMQPFDILTDLSKIFLDNER